MIEPIKSEDEINSELIFKMTRECIDVNYIKEFFTKKYPEIFLVIITRKMIIIIKAIYDLDFHHADIAKKIYDLLDIDEKDSVLTLHAANDGKEAKTFFINYEHCVNQFYSYMDAIYNYFKSIITKTGSKVLCSYIGLPQKVIEKDIGTIQNRNIQYLPGISIDDTIAYLKEQNSMCDWYRKHVVTIIDKDGEIFTVQRGKIKRDKNDNFLYNDEVIQDQNGDKKFLLHGGLRNALMIEIQKKNQKKYKEYKGKIIEERESLIEFGKYGFIVIWPYNPQDIENYYGNRKHLYSESNTYINLPINLTRKQIDILRELASVLIYNPIVKEINAYQYNKKCSWTFINNYMREKNGKMSTDFLNYLDNYNNQIK